MKNAMLKALVVVFAAIAFPQTVAAIQLDQAFVAAEFDLGFGGEGATSDGNSLWVANSISASNTDIIKYDISGGGLAPLGSVNTSIYRIAGLAWDGVNLWTSSEDCTPWPCLRFAQIDPATGSTISTFTAAWPILSSDWYWGGITFDNGSLWKASRPEFKKVDIVTEQVIQSIDGFNLPGIEEGLTFDGQYLYVVSYTDATDPRIWKIDAVTGVLQPDSFALPEGLYNGLAYDGRSLWAVNFSGNTVIKISPTPGRNITLAGGPWRDGGSGNLVPFDVNGDGTTDAADAGKLVGIGLSHAQYFAYEIGIENTGATGDLDEYAFLDVLPDGFRLSADAEGALAGCAGPACDGVVEDTSGDCIVTVSGPKAKKNTIDPRYLTIEPGGLATSAICTTTVYVETTNGGGKGKNAGTFEPKACQLADTDGGTLANTISLNDGVKVFDASTGNLLLGPVGSIQLAPQGCP